MPYEDFRAYLTGYRYFLHEPWHWPPFSVHGMNVPFTKSIALTDSIPLWAALNKAIATAIPAWGPFSERAFIGLWGAIVAALQGATSVAALRGLGQRNWTSVVLAPLFFVALPTFVFRYGHSSLSAHWITIGALALYLRAPPQKPAPVRHYALFTGLLAIAALVNPYQVAMALGVLIATLLQSRDLRTIALWLVSALFVVVFFGWMAGFISTEASAPMGGFEWSSANVLSPLIPVRSAIFGNARWLAEVEAVPYQYEGYDYLGIGFLLLIALHLPHVRRLPGVIRRHPFLFALVVGAGLFSLSNHVYFGSHRILTFEVPAKVRRLTESFRAPGRFIWLPTYVVLLYLLRWGFVQFTTGWRWLVMPALTVVQLVDASGDMKWWRDQTRTAYPHLLDLEGWKSLIRRHRAVHAVPAYDCSVDGTVHVDVVGTEIGHLASEYAAPINGVYSARSTRDCAADEHSWSTIEPLEDTLYVFMPQVARHAYRFEGLGAKCGRFDFGHVCSRSLAAIDDAIRSGVLTETRSLPVLGSGDVLDLRQEASSSFFQYGYAWSPIEANGRWTLGEHASLVFRLRGAVSTLKVSAAAPECPVRPTQVVDIDLNGKRSGTFELDGTTHDDSERSVPISGFETSEERIVQLDLRPHDTRSPKSVACGSDDRPIGILLRRLVFE